MLDFCTVRGEIFCFAFLLAFQPLVGEVNHRPKPGNFDVLHTVPADAMATMVFGILLVTLSCKCSLFPPQGRFGLDGESTEVPRGKYFHSRSNGCRFEAFPWDCWLAGPRTSAIFIELRSLLKLFCLERETGFVPPLERNILFYKREVFFRTLNSFALLESLIEIIPSGHFTWEL